MGSRGSSGNHFGARGFGRDPMLSRFQSFATQQDAIRYHLANNFDWDKWNALLSGEQHGIVSYTDYWYRAINTALREGQTPAGNIQQMIDGATSGLNKWAAAGDVITYRGANLHWTANLLGGTEADLSNPAFLRSRIGRTVVDKGFMSSGTHQNSAWSADVNYKIYVNKGISGMYVDAISANSGEYEFLFNRDTPDDVLDHYPVDRLMHDVALALMAVQTQTTGILNEFPTKAARTEATPESEEIPQF